MLGKRNRLVVRRRGELAPVPLTQVANRVRTVPVNHPLIQAGKAVGMIFGA